MMVKYSVIKEIFAQRLSDLMKSNNETIYTIAELLHLSAATISRYSNAEMAPKITAIEVLAKYFSVNPVWLMGYDVPRKLSPDSKSQNEVKNPDIRAIARAGENMSPEEAAELRKFAERLFPNAFKKPDSE